MKRQLMVAGALLLVVAVVFFIAGQRAYADPPPKVTICHIPPGNPDNAHTIEVGASAVPTHLAHGDTLGECPEGETPPEKCPDGTTGTPPDCVPDTEPPTCEEDPTQEGCEQEPPPCPDVDQDGDCDEKPPTGEPPVKEPPSEKPPVKSTPKPQPTPDQAPPSTPEVDAPQPENTVSVPTVVDAGI